MRTLKKFQLFASLLWLLFTSNAVSSETLKNAFSENFLIGTIWHGHEVNGSKNIFLQKEKEITLREFNVITAENVMKPRFLQPKEGKFRFGAADEMVNFAIKNNLKVVGHTLVWKNSTPDWFFKDNKGNKVDRELLINRLEKHIKKIVGRYKGKLQYWDVVNEAIETKWNPKTKSWDAFYKPCPWLEIIGPEYIEIAYKAAHEADPNAKLLYNDYNLDQEGKLDFALNMIKDFKKRGIPIYGLGYQAHLFLEEPSLDGIERVLKKSQALAIPIHITELDVSVLPNAWKYRTASIEERYELAQDLNPYERDIPNDVLIKQSERYRDIFRLFLKYDNIVERVTFWGVWDGNSWRDYKPMSGRTDYPLLFGRSFEKKLAYETVIKLAK